MKVKIIKFKKAMKLNVKNAFVVCGDIHLYNSYPYNDNTEIISSRLMDINYALDEAASVAELLRLPLILNGDIIMSGIFDFPVEKTLTEFLIKYRHLRIIINLGNHDLDGDNSVITPLVKLSGNKNHAVITKPVMHRISRNYKDCYHFIPYANEAKTISWLNKRISDTTGKGKNILFMHTSFKNSMFANDVKSKSGINQKYFIDGNFSRFDLIVASHIHKYQELFDGKGFYTSSLIPLDFGERSKQHGYHVVDVGNDIRYFVIPKAPKFVHIKTSVEMDDDTLKKKCKGNIVMVINDNNSDLPKEDMKQKLIDYGARFVSFKNKIKKGKYTENISKISSRKTETIISEYSSILAKRLSLDEEELELLGLGILETAKKETSKETQRR